MDVYEPGNLAGDGSEGNDIVELALSPEFIKKREVSLDIFLR